MGASSGHTPQKRHFASTLAGRSHEDLDEQLLLPAIVDHITITPTEPHEQDGIIRYETSSQKTNLRRSRAFAPVEMRKQQQLQQALVRTKRLQDLLVLPEERHESSLLPPRIESTRIAVLLALRANEHLALLGGVSPGKHRLPILSLQALELGQNGLPTLLGTHVVTGRLKTLANERVRATRASRVLGIGDNRVANTSTNLRKTLPFRKTPRYRKRR